MEATQMKPKSQIFTPENTYALIRVMLQTIGVDIASDYRKFKANICIMHNHLDLLVKEDCDGLFRLETWTKNETLLMSVTFEDTEIGFDIGYRLRTDVMRMPKDRSMLEALGLYLMMMPAADQYLEDHFIGGHDSVVDDEVLRRFEPARADH